MNRIATARNATYIGIAGALLWLVRMPSFQLESLASPINAPGIDVVVRTFSGVALIGITAIATATGLNALMSRRRPASLASLAMIAGLVTYAIWLGASTTR